MSSLAEALPAEMARVRHEVMPAYREIGPAGAIALAMMRHALDGAANSAASGDVVEMLRSLEQLKGFHT